MDAIAQKSIRIDLTRELERCAEQDLERLRRTLLGTDLIAREKAAALIPHAEAELRKWCNSRVAYENERDRLRYALNDIARALPR